jgi:hypothetical protein
VDLDQGDERDRADGEGSTCREGVVGGVRTKGCLVGDRTMAGECGYARVGKIFAGEEKTRRVIRNVKQRCFICFYGLSPGSTCRPARVNDCDRLTCKPMIELVLTRCHLWLFL